MSPRFLFAFTSLTVFGADAAQDGVRWWSHVQVLADDKMEGRETGSEGHHKAARYVASEFERNSLNPAGASGYFQAMKFNVRRLDEPASSLAIVRNGKSIPLVLGNDASLSLRADLAPDVDAPAVFVGFGLVIPEKGIDDLADLDLKGKIVVYLNGGPSSVPSALKAHYSSAAERWKAFQKAGIIGIASIANPKSMDIPWDRQKLARLNPTMSFIDSKLVETTGMQFSVTVNPANAEKLFAGSRHTFA